jgi:hypothetical protein
MSVRKKKNLPLEDFRRRARQDSNLRPSLFVASPSSKLCVPVGLDKALLASPYSHFPFWASPEPVKPERVSGTVSGSSEELFIP